MLTTTFEVTADVWRADGPGDRHFVTLPPEVADELRARFGGSHHAVGPLPVSVELGRSMWSTSLYADADSGSYVIAIRDGVRRRERVRDQQTVTLRFVVKR